MDKGQRTVYKVPTRNPKPETYSSTKLEPASPNPKPKTQNVFFDTIKTCIPNPKPKTQNVFFDTIKTCIPQPETQNPKHYLRHNQNLHPPTRNPKPKT